jgi:hypothetical protein
MWQGLCNPPLPPPLNSTAAAALHWQAQSPPPPHSHCTLAGPSQGVPAAAGTGAARAVRVTNPVALWLSGVVKVMVVL